ncbi:MAG: hypothetical protein ACKOEX_13420 [Planctomycetia bacterium]
MRRIRTAEIESAGQDSFLDVVTNIVGILIILVMVVGGRAQSLVLTAPPATEPRLESLEHEVETLEASVAMTEREVQDLVDQGEQVTVAAMGAGAARVELATAVSAATRELEKRQSDADAGRVKAAEVAVKKEWLKKEIEQTELEADGLAHAPQTTTEVLAYPTPIGRTVTGEEIHFRLEGNRIAYIPLTELFEMAKAQTHRQSGNLASMAARIETVGPAQDFTLDYVIETKIDQARGQVLVRSREWVVRPIGAGVGETIDAAVLPRSRFHGLLANATPDVTVTLWCYPDAFEGFRRIREELLRLGISTACRPLPEGAPIGGSTDGSKSVAQ